MERMVLIWPERKPFRLPYFFAAAALFLHPPTPVSKFKIRVITTAEDFFFAWVTTTSKPARGKRKINQLRPRITF